MYEFKRTSPMTTATVQYSSCSETNAPAPSTNIIRIFTISDHSFPLRAILEGSWCTASVCFISHQMAYCVFPALSFLSQRSFLLGQPSVRGGGVPRGKVPWRCQRGLELDRELSAYEGGQVGHSMQKCRKVGDRFTWKVSFGDLRNDNECHITGGIFARRELLMDPIQSGDILYISENRSPIPSRLTGGDRFHYDAKYMRYNNIYRWG